MHPVRHLAASAARTVGRRLRERRERGGRTRVRGHGEPVAAAEPRAIPLPQAHRLRLAEAPGEPESLAEAAPLPDDARADAAELDSLRGALVHELDRLAARDDGSASFRRAS
jgi:hypothetical protein